MRPGAASPFHVPNHRAVRSGSVTLAHTSSMGARKVRLTMSWLPFAVRASRPLGWLIRCAGSTPLASGAVDLGLQRVEVTLPAGGSGELVEPLDQVGQWRRVELVDALTADEGVADQAAFPQYPQMSADGGSADREPVGDLPRGETLLAQHHEDVPPNRVGDRRGHVVHGKRVTILLRVCQRRIARTSDRWVVAHLARLRTGYRYRGSGGLA
jgi:hypothetical protein